MKTTAGTNRVCSRCLALKDTVVGYTDELGVLLPPLHPRCRCAIIYDEVGTPRAMQPKPTINPLLPAAVATEIISPATPEPQTEPRESTNDFNFDIQRFGGQKLPDGKYNLEINIDKQRKHFEGTKNIQIM